MRYLPLLLLYASPLVAQSSMRWTRANIVQAAVPTTLIVADCHLTQQNLASNPYHIERNIFLGSRPSAGTINTFCGAAILGTWFIGHQFRAKDRKWWFGAVAALESYAVVWNLVHRH